MPILSVHGLDATGHVTVLTIEQAVLSEFESELNIKLAPNSFDLTHSLLAFYRNFVEGGKPQFLFHITVGEEQGASIKASAHKYLWYDHVSNAKHYGLTHARPKRSICKGAFNVSYILSAR
jgi:hypothetical protein